MSICHPAEHEYRILEIANNMRKQVIQGLNQQRPWNRTNKLTRVRANQCDAGFIRILSLHQEITAAFRFSEDAMTPHWLYEKLDRCWKHVCIDLLLGRKDRIHRYTRFFMDVKNIRVLGVGTSLPDYHDEIQIAC